MVNYARAFSQSESGKYFEWIIESFIIVVDVSTVVATGSRGAAQTAPALLFIIISNKSQQYVGER